MDAPFKIDSYLYNKPINGQVLSMRTLKVVLIGETRVGKTSLLQRYVEDTFEENQPTIGAAFSTKVVPTPNGTTQLNLWDTAGQEQFRALASMYYRNAHVALFVYDWTRKETFSALSEWVKTIENNASGNIKIFVVGNKTDLGARATTRDEVREFAESIHAQGHFETSAKTGAGVNDLFRAVTQIDPDSERSESVTLLRRDRNENACC